MHGDDYCSVGPSDTLNWLQRVFEKQYRIKMQRIGAGKDLEGKDKLHEGQVPNCVIRLTEDGYELEADLRHAELIVE